jgi:Gamma-glutamyl cyclotransferase, AIG2-like
MKGYVRLFQYGSNMSPSRLNSSCRLRKKARRPKSARLEGWGVRFDLYSTGNECGVANIVEVTGEYVLGIVYQVPARLIYARTGRRSKMDEIEGVQLDGKGNYKRQRIDGITVDGEKVSAVTYVGTSHGKRRFLLRSQQERAVSSAYFSHLLKGAEKFAFSEKYISYLRRQVGALKDQI